MSRENMTGTTTMPHMTTQPRVLCVMSGEDVGASGDALWLKIWWRNSMKTWLGWRKALDPWFGVV